MQKYITTTLPFMSIDISADDAHHTHKNLVLAFILLSPALPDFLNQ